MSEERKDENKEQSGEGVEDLEPQKDAKGGGGFTKQSPSGGGSTTQPINPGGS